MADIEDSSALSRILTCSDRYLDSRPQPIRSATTPVLPIHVNLPEPPPLFPVLVAAGAKQEVAQAMQAAYHKRACEFREQALLVISSACLKLAQIPSPCSHGSDETIAMTFKQVYLKKLNTWISEGVALLQEKGPSVLRCQEDTANSPSKSPKTFNHQYVPLLEHFFEENPFPTHADKVFLAKKSNMSYRQIHVWFQNRRNRTKKSLHKKPTSGGVAVPLETLIGRMGKFAVPPTTKSDMPPSKRSSPLPSSTELYDLLDGVAPPHAFPTVYPPSCGYDPFPSVPTFVTPEWSRRPVLSLKTRQSVVDVDKLTEQFSRLNVLDDSLSRSRRKTGRAPYDSLAATAAFTVKPCPAPHPARICNTTSVAPTCPRKTFKPIPATASSLHVFRSPSPNSPMATLVPAPACRRKVASLPKRLPSRPPLTIDRETSASSTGSSSPASSPRSPSFGPETSMEDSRSIDSSSSNSSSTVTTPEASPSPLPHPS